ncbi:MAG TPA: hypothetical protein VH144_03290 [Candidatus Saccharimonadales bacterium]|jgi:hypothetical protein|nr:hypothetical protein [Candidatus Saccharimonadales bacterium]
MGEYDGPAWGFDKYLEFFTGNHAGNYITRGPKSWQLWLWALFASLTKRSVRLRFIRKNGTPLMIEAINIVPYYESLRGQWLIVGSLGPLHEPTRQPGHQEVVYSTVTRVGSSAIVSAVCAKL